MTLFESGQRGSQRERLANIWLTICLWDNGVHLFALEPGQGSRRHLALALALLAKLLALAESQLSPRAALLAVGGGPAWSTTWVLSSGILPQIWLGWSDGQLLGEQPNLEGNAKEEFVQRFAFSFFLWALSRVRWCVCLSFFFFSLKQKHVSSEMPRRYPSYPFFPRPSFALLSFFCNQKTKSWVSKAMVSTSNFISGKQELSLYEVKWNTTFSAIGS